MFLRPPNEVVQAVYGLGDFQHPSPSAVWLPPWWMWQVGEVLAYTVHLPYLLDRLTLERLPKLLPALAVAVLIGAAEFNPGIPQTELGMAEACRALLGRDGRRFPEWRQSNLTA